MLYGKSVFGMIVSSIGCIWAADQGSIDFGAGIQIIILISICVLLSMFNRLFLANVTNIELAILLEMITVRATVVWNHRGLLLRSASVIIVVVTFSFPWIFYLALFSLGAQRSVALVFPWTRVRMLIFLVFTSWMIPVIFPAISSDLRHGRILVHIPVIVVSGWGLISLLRNGADYIVVV